MKFTRYFEEMRLRPDRAIIKLEWISYVIENPAEEVVQKDGRIRLWAPIEELYIMRFLIGGLDYEDKVLPGH